MNVKERLKQYIDYKGIKQSKFTKSIGVSTGYINAIRKSIQDDKILLIKEYYPDLNIEWLLYSTGEMLIKNNNNALDRELKEKNYTNTLSVRIVTTKARAGFTDAYYADEYLDDLPTILIEADKEYKGKYLAFEVDGDSMEPEYNKGDVVICREIQRHLWQYKLHFKEYDFVIAHGTKGVMLKEIINHNVDTGEITCRSINNEDGKHGDFILNLREVAFLYNVVEHRISGKSKRRNR